VIVAGETTHKLTPDPRLTCWTGKDLDEVFITTADCAQSDEPERASEFVNSGRLFRISLKGLYSGAKWRHSFGN